MAGVPLQEQPELQKNLGLLLVFGVGLFFGLHSGLDRAQGIGLGLFCACRRLAYHRVGSIKARLTFTDRSQHAHGGADADAAIRRTDGCSTRYTGGANTDSTGPTGRDAGSSGANADSTGRSSANTSAASSASTDTACGARRALGAGTIALDRDRRPVDGQWRDRKYGTDQCQGREALGHEACHHFLLDVT
jgi:hypothetical protein